MSSLLQHGARKTLTDCREKHVVQKQCDKDDEENQFPRLTPSREALHHFCRQPRRITDNHCRRRLTSTVRQKKIRETSATITSFTVHRSTIDSCCSCYRVILSDSSDMRCFGDIWRRRSDEQSMASACLCQALASFFCSTRNRRSGI